MFKESICNLVGHCTAKVTDSIIISKHLKPFLSFDVSLWHKGALAHRKNLLYLGPRVHHSTCKLFVFQDDCLLSLVEVLEYLSAQYIVISS